ncbi:MAG: AAA family ATPase [Actinomycetota bacterium]|nr:AAA family ATPase [Actinomycetota bacterium]
MIERLELRHWRAFEHVAIDFQPGTTFLVAPNGVGKTSLLLGLTWALFGDYSKVDAKTCVRIGHNKAEATVTISVGEGRKLVIYRTVTTAGKATVEYRDTDQRIDDAGARELLADEFGAPIEIAARLAVIRSGHDDGELQLREHLYDAFGVSGLRRAAASAAKLHKEAVAARKRLRSASRAQLANRDQLAAQAEKLRNDLNGLSARRARLGEAVARAMQAQQAVATWATHDTALAEHTSAVAALVARANHRGMAASNLDELAEELSNAIAANRAATDEVQTVVDEARAQMLAARTALALLEGHDPSCPTCARPFHGDELDRAIAAQNDSFALAQARTETASAELQRLASEQTQLNDLWSSVEELSESPAEPSTPRPIGNPDAALAAAQESVREHDELAGSIASERDAIVAQLNNDEELRAAYEVERVAWRREALTQAAAAALAGTAERLATEYIEPLSRQVRWRWKALFGEDGLQLRPDGTIVRVVGDRELPWSQLSSGEQIWARLVASLLVLRSSTTLPFAWLDEPLEHLDPRARRIVATDLAASTQSGRPAQLIVTTYEHTLARQLAEDLPDTHLRQINRTEAIELPPRRRADRPTEEGEGSSAEGEANPAA